MSFKDLFHIYKRTCWVCINVYLLNYIVINMFFPQKHIQKPDFKYNFKKVMLTSLFSFNNLQKPCWLLHRECLPHSLTDYSCQTEINRRRTCCVASGGCGEGGCGWGSRWGRAYRCHSRLLCPCLLQLLWTATGASDTLMTPADLQPREARG